MPVPVEVQAERFDWSPIRDFAEILLMGGVLCGEAGFVDTCRDPGYVFHCDWRGRIVREVIGYFDMGGAPDAGHVGRYLYLRGIVREESAMEEITDAVEVFASWTRGEWRSIPSPEGRRTGPIVQSAADLMPRQMGSAAGHAERAKGVG